MKAKLICKTGSMDGVEFEIEKEATIGKSYQNTIMLDQNDISRNHARVYFDDAAQRYFLEDLRSSNGTYLDGEKIYENEPLSHIHVVTFGDRLEFFFQVLKNEECLIELETPQNENQISVIDDVKVIKSAKTIIADDFPKVPKFAAKFSQVDTDRSKNDNNDIHIMDEQQLLTSEELPEIIHRSEAPLDLPKVSGKHSRKENSLNFDFSEDPGSGKHNVSQGHEKVNSGFVLNIKGLKKSIVLKEGGNVVGRIPTCDITVDDETVSRQHACILVDNNTVRLNDLGSKNFTFFGMKKIRSTREITPNKIIRFGEVEAILRHQDAW